MRFIKSNSLVPGQTVGRTVYGKFGNVLLHKGVELTNFYISALAKMDLIGIYIEDKFSSDIEIKELISEEIKNEVTVKVKSIYLSATAQSAVFDKSLQDYLNEIIDEIISNRGMMYNIVDLKSFDDYTFHHCVNVTVLSLLIGVSMDMCRKTLYNLAIAAIYHDIGKMFLDKNILNKNGRLTPEEFDEIKKHPEIGFHYVKDKHQLPLESAVTILQHHERVDGSGYPNQKTGEELLLSSKIVAVADVFDALTSKRPYREPENPAHAMEYIMSNAGTHFDMDVVQVFVRKVAAYSNGTTVKLSNGVTAIVVENYEGFSTRPLVKVITEDPEQAYYLNLKDDHSLNNITITGIGD